jgi:hypothetical protein
VARLGSASELEAAWAAGVGVVVVAAAVETEPGTDQRVWDPIGSSIVLGPCGIGLHGGRMVEQTDHRRRCIGLVGKGVGGRERLGSCCQILGRNNRLVRWRG